MSKLKLFILSISLILFSFVFMLIPIKANPVLSASPSNIFFGPNKKITVTYSGAPGYDSDWIGLFKANAGEREYITYQYLKGSKSGTLTFGAPEEVGKYEFRMWEKEWTRQIAKSNIVNIEYGPTSLEPKISLLYIGPNKKITVTYSGAPGYDNDWIGLFKVGAGEKSWVSYQYLKGKTSGTLEFIAPESPDNYEFRLWTREYTKHLKTSKPIVVQWGPINIKASLSPSDSSGNQKFTVTYSGAPGYDNDWIGLFKVGAGEKSWVSYQYLKGKTSGTLQFDCPKEKGSYEFRMWAKEYTKLLGKSDVIQVGSGGGNGGGSGQFVLYAYPGDGKVYLEWTAIVEQTNLIGYNIYRKTPDSNYKIPITDFPINGLNYIDPNVDNGVLTCYYAKAVYRGNRESNQSNEVCVTPHKPKIEVSIPDNAKTNNPSYTFTGKVDPGSKITVNGSLVSVNSDGTFTATVTLKPGSNTITIIVTNKAGDTIRITKTVEYTGTTPGGKVVIILKINSKTAYVNDVTNTLDVAPFIDRGRTFVPFRFIGEALGAEVGYTTDSNGRVKTVSYKLGNNSITLTIGQKEAIVNGKVMKMDVPPQIIQGRTVIPLRFVTEALGCNVDWNGETMTITITYPAK
ncbi:MAG: hypothetical protein KBH94_05605 [Caldisericia bacterium]|nr:hypothetical protein [Caldisericia bacterium]